MKANETGMHKDFNEFLEARNFSALQDLIDRLSPPEISDVFYQLEESKRLQVFSMLPEGKSTDVFEYLGIDIQKYLISMLPPDDVTMILDTMSPDDRTALLEVLSTDVASRLLGMLSPTERKIALKLLDYPENSIGRLMTTEFIAIREEWTVREVLRYIRKHGRDSETFNVVYVVDDKNSLIDDIRIRELLLASPDVRVSTLMKRSFVALSVTQEEEEAVLIFQKHDRVALPVINSKGMLVGIVTIDDILAVAAEQSTEDMIRFGGTQAISEPYISTSGFDMVRKRGFWLIILFFGEMLATEVLSVFEDTIASLSLLAVFIPLITSSGGNAGSQAAIIIIRSISVGELMLKDWWKVVKREVVTGSLLGLALGSLGFLQAAFKTMDLGEGLWVLVGLSIALSIICVVLWGTLIGSMLPFILQSLKLDPATSSGPVVATIVDISGVIIYFTAAHTFLSHIL